MNEASSCLMERYRGARAPIIPLNCAKNDISLLYDYPFNPYDRVSFPLPPTILLKIMRAEEDEMTLI